MSPAKKTFQASFPTGFKDMPIFILYAPGFLRFHDHPSLITLISENHPFPAYSLLNFRDCSTVVSSYFYLPFRESVTILILLTWYPSNVNVPQKQITTIPVATRKEKTCYNRQAVVKRRIPAKPMQTTAKNRPWDLRAARQSNVSACSDLRTRA